MPTYEYACMDCGTHVEVFQHFSDDPLTTCGNCGGRLRKVFHPAGILFKGSGFYKTDSRSSSSKSPREPSKAASSPSDSKSTSGTGSTSSESSGSGSAGSAEPGGSGAKSSSDSGSKSAAAG